MGKGGNVSKPIGDFPKSEQFGSYTISLDQGDWEILYHYDDGGDDVAWKSSHRTKAAAIRKLLRMISPELRYLQGVDRRLRKELGKIVLTFIGSVP